jgi:hypothetical protein
MESLEKAAVDTGIPFIKPVLDVSTRWNSTHDMLQSALKLKPVSTRNQSTDSLLIVIHKKALTLLCASNIQLEEFQFSNVEWRSFEYFQEFLSPLVVVTNYLSQKDCLPGTMIPFFNFLIDHFEKYKKPPTGIAAKIKLASQDAVAKLVEYYEHTGFSKMLTTALEPRNRLQYFREIKCPREWTEQMTSR